jgi:hypothetical protein
MRSSEENADVVLSNGQEEEEE